MPINLYPCITIDCIMSTSDDDVFDFKSEVRAARLVLAWHRDWFMVRPRIMRLSASRDVVRALSFYAHVPLVRKNGRPMLWYKLHFRKASALPLRWRPWMRIVLKSMNFRNKQLRLKRAWRRLESRVVYMRVMAARADLNSIEFERTLPF